MMPTLLKTALLADGTEIDRSTFAYQTVGNIPAVASARSTRDTCVGMGDTVVRETVGLCTVRGQLLLCHTWLRKRRLQ